MEPKNVLLGNLKGRVYCPPFLLTLTPKKMTSYDFQTAAHGTRIITGTDAVTGSFAGFFAPVETVVAALVVNGASVTPATYLGSATIPAGCLVTISGYTNEIFATSITLTSGSLIAIKG